MAKDNSGPGACVVVVGDPAEAPVQTAVRLARAGGLEVRCCADVYAAVAALAGAAGRRLLVVGKMQDLARENGSFFSLLAAHAVRCYCLLDGDRPAGAAPLHAALQAGTTLISAASELEGVLREGLAPVPSSGVPRTTNTEQEDLRATEAELSALLG